MIIYGKTLLDTERRNVKKSKMKNEWSWMWPWVTLCGPIMAGQVSLSDAGWKFICGWSSLFMIFTMILLWFYTIFTSLSLFLQVFPYYSIHSKGQSQVASVTNLGRRHLQKRFVKFSAVLLLCMSVLKLWQQVFQGCYSFTIEFNDTVLFPPCIGSTFYDTILYSVQ